MKKLPCLFVLVALLGGCASLSQTVFDQVHEGQSPKEIMTLFGKPDAFIKTSTETAWSYAKKGDICAILFKNDQVTSSSCSKNPNYKNPLAEGLKKMGEGMQPPKKQKMNCRPGYSGDYDCQEE